MHLFGIKLVKNKALLFFLKSIFGLGLQNSIKIIKKIGITLNFKVKNLTKNQTLNLVKTIQSLNVFLTTDLQKFRLSLFKRLLKLKLNKAVRKNNGLPIRGQRTKTNGKTARKFFKF